MESKLTAEDMESIRRISENVKDNIERQTRKIQRAEFKLCPTLMMLFTIQDNIQYQEILGNNSEILGNNEKQVEDKMKNRFQEILKLAYVAYKNPKEYCINGVSMDLETYRGETVPKNGLISYPPLDFATYAIQQMQNKDFDNEDIVNEIADKLGIKEEKRKEISDIAMDDIYKDAPMKVSRPKPQNGFKGRKSSYRVKKERYSKSDVMALAHNTIGINEESSYIIFCGVKLMLENKERTDKTKGRDEL